MGLLCLSLGSLRVGWLMGMMVAIFIIFEGKLKP